MEGDSCKGCSSVVRRWCAPAPEGALHAHHFRGQLCFLLARLKALLVKALLSHQY